MSPRLFTALEAAARLCRAQAAAIRAALPEEDGAIDSGPRKTPDGLWEADAAEWDEDARLIEEHLADDGRPVRLDAERTNP